MHRRSDELGIVAIFDTLVFLIVAILLSVSLLIASTLVARESTATAEEQLLGYADHTLRAYVQSTLPNATYRDADGEQVVRPPGTTAAGFLIAEDLAVRDEGAPAGNFAELEGNLSAQLRSLIRGDLDYLLEARYGAQTVHLPIGKDQSDLPRRTYAATQQLSMVFGKPGEVTVVLWVWPRA